MNEMNEYLVNAVITNSVVKANHAILCGADVNYRDPRNYDATPLQIAGDLGHTGMCQFLIAQGADVNVKDERSVTPLHDASKAGRLAIAKLLVAAGADVNAKDYIDCTPLHYAAYQPTPEICKLLLENGANPNGFDSAEYTPIDCARELDRDENIELIKKYMTEKH